MTEEKWPNRLIAYAGDIGGRAATERWQKALDAAIADGSLTWIPRETGHTTHTWDLAGSCPRCGHAMSYSCVFYVYGFNVKAPDQPSFAIPCNCREDHSGRGERAEHGCGWNDNVSVNFWEPESGGDGG